MLQVLEEAALRTLVLAALVKCSLWLLRIRRPQLLLSAWTVILAASLAMPALHWAIPLRLPIGSSLPSTILIGAADPQPQTSALEAPRPALEVKSQRPVEMRPWLETVYLAVSSILLLRLTVGLALSLRMMGKAGPVPLEWAANANIRISRYVAAPVTVANVILLPADAIHWPAAMRLAVLAHEHAHVARWDFAMLLLSQVNRAVFWFSPLSWWLHRRLAALAELASDDRAMEVTGDRPRYAEVLLEMARRSGPTLHGLAMARQATLRYRIERILDERVRADPVSPIQQVILAISATGLSIAVASPELNSALPPNVTALTEQQKPSAPPEAPLSLPAQAATDLPQSMLLLEPRVGMASKARQPSGHPVPTELSAVISRSRPLVRMTARPPARNFLDAQSSHVTRQPEPASNGQVAPKGSLGAEAVAARNTPLHPITSLDPANRSDAVAEHRQASTSRLVGYVPDRERPVLRLINNQICTGVYMPQRATGLVDSGLNLIRAKFFQDANGTPWLTFFPGGQTPVTQPVMVTHGEDKLTALNDVVFTMVPRSARHLDGFIKRSYGTIDFDCGTSDAHLFDGAS